MIEIYYYSGTGFTLKAAKMLKKELKEPVALIPVTGAMAGKQKESRAKIVGLLMPMHAFGVPAACRTFLQSFCFLEAEYIFAFVTCGGAPARMYREIDRYLRRQNKKLNAFQYGVTPNTFEIILKVHSHPDVLRARDNFERDVVSFAGVVQNRENGIKLMYRNRLLEYTLFPLLKMISRRSSFFNLEKDFYVDESCTACGRCEKICQSGKIEIGDKGPRWREDVSCHFCLACIHLCPERAIQVRKTKSPELERIFCGDISWQEIASQKQEQEYNILT